MSDSLLQQKLNENAGSSPNRWGTMDAVVEVLAGASGGGGAITAPLGPNTTGTDAVAIVPAANAQFLTFPQLGNGQISHGFFVPASTTANIPVDNSNWSFVILTGTADVTFGSDAAQTLPAGLGDSSDRPANVGIGVTTAANSTAYVRYSTATA